MVLHSGETKGGRTTGCWKTWAGPIHAIPDLQLTLCMLTMKLVLLERMPATLGDPSARSGGDGWAKSSFKVRDHAYQTHPAAVQSGNVAAGSIHWGPGHIVSSHTLVACYGLMAEVPEHTHVCGIIQMEVPRR